MMREGPGPSPQHRRGEGSPSPEGAHCHPAGRTLALALPQTAHVGGSAWQTQEAHPPRPGCHEMGWSACSLTHPQAWAGQDTEGPPPARWAREAHTCPGGLCAQAPILGSMLQVSPGLWVWGGLSPGEASGRRSRGQKVQAS